MQGFGPPMTYQQRRQAEQLLRTGPYIHTLSRVSDNSGAILSAARAGFNTLASSFGGKGQKMSLRGTLFSKVTGEMRSFTGTNKRQRITKYADDDEGKVQTSKGIRAKPASSELAMHLYKGQAWQQFWKDPRSFYSKVISPAQQVTTRVDDVIFAVNSGVQGIQEKEHWTAVQLQKYLDTFVASQHDPLGNTGALEIKGSGLGTTVSSIQATTKMVIPLSQYRHLWHNSGNSNCTLQIYEYLCVRDCDESPETLWKQTVQQPAGEQLVGGSLSDWDTGIEGTGGDTTDKAAVEAVLDLHERPHGWHLDAYWKRVAYTKAHIQPGRNLYYTMNAVRHSIRNAELERSPVTKYVQGWSKVLLLIAHGELVASNIGSTVTSTCSIQLRHAIESNWVMYNTLNPQTKRTQVFLAAQDSPVSGWPVIGVADQRFENTETDTATTGFDTSH